MITIIDYRLGNLFSVKNALDYLGIAAKISRDPGDIVSADKLILPGVGGFADGIANINKQRLRAVLDEQVLHKHKPILGLCLGMQLLMGESFEGGRHKGLGWIDGTVRKITPKNNKLKVPHIGWNDVRLNKNSPLTVGLDNPVFYFVHSYVVVPADKRIVVGFCDYGGEFAAVIQKDNIFGAQFHPEKSQNDGLTVLKNFSEV